MGYYAVREIGITWDFPELAMFWLHVSYAACTATIVDALGRYCPNVYTRPFEWAVFAEQETGLAITTPMRQALRLQRDVDDAIVRLERMHAIVNERFNEPKWPDAMRESTRYEYRYFSSPLELQWRIRVARAMAEAGDVDAALYYVRFFAYLVARLVMVSARAAEGLDTTFSRPRVAVRPDLERHCPLILEDLSHILGGSTTRADVELSIHAVRLLRQEALEEIHSRGIELGPLREWAPYRREMAS